MTFTSNNLQEKLNLLLDIELQKIKLGFKWIQLNISQSVIIGGVAVVSYTSGDRLLTPDLDIIVSDIDLVKEKLDSQGIKYDYLTNDLGITIQVFNLDILDAKTGNNHLNQLILSDPIEHKIYEQNCSVIQTELLTILKLELGREKDLEDGLRLLQSGSLNQNLYMDYLDQLKDYLNEYESLYSYSQLLK